MFKITFQLLFLSSKHPLLPLSFYQDDDPVAVARALLGKVLCTAMAGGLTTGIIVETEAYNGRTDAACHAHLGRRTRRTEIMYAPGGVAYVYLCYGLHQLFNIITNGQGLADAVLIRAAQPLEGMELMAARRGRGLHPTDRAPGYDPVLARGPGSLSKAFGIAGAHYGASLLGPDIWIEDRDIAYAPGQVLASPRIGVDYAGGDAALPWRFFVAGNPCVSASKQGVVV